MIEIYFTIINVALAIVIYVLQGYYRRKIEFLKSVINTKDKQLEEFGREFERVI